MALLTGSYSTDVMVTFATVLAVFIAYLKLWKYKYWERMNVPYLEPSLFVGNFWDLFSYKVSTGQMFTRFYDEMKSKNMKFGGVYLLFKPILILADPELMKTIMIKDFNSFHDRGETVINNNGPLSKSLLNSTGQLWKQQRVKLTQTFTSGKIKCMFQTLVKCSEGISRLIEDHRDLSIDIKEMVARYTTDCIGFCFLGIECNSLKDPEAEFRRVGRVFTKVTTADAVKCLLTMAFPNFSKKLKLSIQGPMVSDFFVRVVKETVDYRERNGIKRRDFMDLLIQLKNNGKLDDDDGSAGDESLTMDQLTSHTFMFFAAGFETSSIALTFCLFELAQNVQVQNRLREEILQVLKANGGNLTYEAVMEMKYMDKVVNESLRKHPPVPQTARECTTDYKIPGTDIEIKKGTRLIFPIMGLHRDPEFYPDPEIFDPDRFDEENKKQRHPFSHLPFGEGPRNCIGLRFSILQIKVGIVALLKQHQWTLDPKTILPLVSRSQSPLYSSKNIIWLRAVRI